MFMQNTTPNQIATWRGSSCPKKPISSTGSLSTIGRNTGMMSNTMPTQSMKAPMKRRMSIMKRITIIGERSVPRMKLAT